MFLSQKPRLMLDTLFLLCTINLLRSQVSGYEWWKCEYPWRYPYMDAETYIRSLCLDRCDGNNKITLEARRPDCITMLCFPCDCHPVRCQALGICCPKYDPNEVIDLLSYSSLFWVEAQTNGPITSTTGYPPLEAQTNGPTTSTTGYLPVQQLFINPVQDNPMQDQFNEEEFEDEEIITPNSNDNEMTSAVDVEETTLCEGFCPPSSNTDDERESFTTIDPEKGPSGQKGGFSPGHQEPEGSDQGESFAPGSSVVSSTREPVDISSDGIPNRPTSTVYSGSNTLFPRDNPDGKSAQGKEPTTVGREIPSTTDTINKPTNGFPEGPISTIHSRDPNFEGDHGNNLAGVSLNTQNPGKESTEGKQRDGFTQQIITVLPGNNQTEVDQRDSFTPAPPEPSSASKLGEESTKHIESRFTTPHSSYHNTTFPGKAPTGSDLEQGLPDDRITTFKSGDNSGEGDQGDFITLPTIRHSSTNRPINIITKGSTKKGIITLRPTDDTLDINTEGSTKTGIITLPPTDDPTTRVIRNHSTYGNQENVFTDGLPAIGNHANKTTEINNNGSTLEHQSHSGAPSSENPITTRHSLNNTDSTPKNIHTTDPPLEVDSDSDPSEHEFDSSIARKRRDLTEETIETPTFEDTSEISLSCVSRLGLDVRFACVNTCPPGYPDLETAQLCETHAPTEVDTYVPVMAFPTLIIYCNKYCAMCNSIGHVSN